MMLEDFKFHDPNMLFLLAVIAVMAFCATVWQKSALRKIEKFAGFQLTNESSPSCSPRAFDHPTIFLLVSFAFLIFALARPQANPIFEERQSKVLDIIVVLDLSNSMNAEDIYPSRLKKAKRTIGTMLDRLSGDRVGLVAFAGSSALISPLTSDYSIIRTFVTALDTTTIQNQGTNIESALQTAEKAFNRGSANTIDPKEKSHVILIISDGEFTTGSSIAAAKKLQEQGIIVHTLAIGSDRGVPIPIRDGEGNLRAYKKNVKRETVITSVDIKGLARLAAAGGGSAYVSTLDEREINSLVADIGKLNRAATKTFQTRVYSEYFYIPLAIGLFFFALSLLPKRMTPAPSSALLLMILFSQFADSSPAFANLMEGETPEETEEVKEAPPPSLKSRAEQLIQDEERRASLEAIRNYKAGKFQESADLFKRLQVDNSQSPEIAYGAGTSLIQAGQVQEGRSMLTEVQRMNEAREGKSQSLDLISRFNIAGSYGTEKNFGSAIKEYASLIEKYNEVEKLSPVEQVVLEQAKKNIEYLFKEQEKEKEKQKQDQQKKQEKDKDKQDKKKDGSGSENQDEKNEKKKDENQKSKSGEDKKGDEEKDSDQKPKKPNFSKRKKFKGNERLDAKTAKRILEALKNKEQMLQKKFLNDKGKRRRRGSSGKDW